MPQDQTQSPVAPEQNGAPSNGAGNGTAAKTNGNGSHQTHGETLVVPDEAPQTELQNGEVARQNFAQMTAQSGSGSTGWTPGFRAQTASERALKFARHFTQAGQDPFATAQWERRTASITGENGKSVFEQRDCEIPAHWSQLATNVVVSKYFRGPMDSPSRETSVRQVIGRVADTIGEWGKQGGYFQNSEEAGSFRDELVYLLLHQYGAFNSPVWFNLGVKGSRAQASACFINSVYDDMESIMELAATEARLFKGGSGAGTNLFRIRSSREQLSGGGIASGPVSFMRGWDAFAGAIKCLTPDAYVYTQHGMKSLGEIIDPALEPGFHADESVVLASKDGPARISHVYVSPQAPTYNLELRHTGLRLRGTGEHPVLTLAPDFSLVWKKLSEVEGGDRVAVSRRSELWPEEASAFPSFAPNLTWAKKHLTFPAQMTPELARLLGYLVSEGCMDDERFRFCNADRDAFDDFLSCVQAVFGVDPSSNVGSRVHPRTGVTTWQFEACWPNAVRFLSHVGLTKELSAFKTVPWSIRQSPRALVVEFLRAYFEGDGHVSTHVYASSASRPLLGEIQLLLLNMGMLPLLRPHPVNGKPYWSLYLRGEQAFAFVREVGFISARKQAMAQLAGDKNTNIDTVPFLAEALRARTDKNGYFRCADGTKQSIGFGFFNRKTGSAISHKLLRQTPGLADKMNKVNPEWAQTLEFILEHEIFWDTALPIEEAPCAVTYDFTVPGTHSFIANGIVNHNSGGTTRRAAKMVILNADHPDIAEFIVCKANEEKKAWALIDAGFNGGFNVPGGAYDSVAFQNANHSVRVTDEFMRAAENGATWQTRAITTGKVVETLQARDLLHSIAQTTHICGDPGLQYDTTLNDWHTCPNTGRINASNPCSEFVFLDDTACLTQDVRVSTPEGLRTMGQLWQAQENGEQVRVSTDLVSEQDHRRLLSHRRAWVSQTGEKLVFKIELNDGRRIRATGNHRFLTEEGWKRVDALTVGKDRIEIRKSGNAVAFSSEESEVSRWQMLGWLSGDGVFSKGNVALVFGGHEELTARSMEAEFNRLLLDSYAFVQTAVPVSPNGETMEMALPRGGCHLGQQANGVWQITSKATALVTFLEQWYGFKQNTAIHKDVPSGLHHIADDLKVAYLQGLFSADGCIRCDAHSGNEEVMLASSSPEMLRSVQLLLSDLGIASRLGWTHPQGRKNPQGQLHIYNQQARSFLSLVGFACSGRKQARAEEILSRPFEGQLKNPRAAKVVSIVPDGVEMVYDITEPVTHSFIAEGLLTHNCNLASINLLKFYDFETGHFDAPAYVHACETFLTAQEIIVSFASYPTAKIAENSELFRPLGLGYCNIGALLMAMGLAYDSDEGRAFAGALTAIMTGAAYRQSARIARNTGPFEGYAKNREPMLRVIGKHRDAVARIDHSLVAPNVMEEAHKCWDEALMLGQKHGYRNSQTTVLAPTGTISFMMDADTTGVEPDIALVKYKKLVGGGLLKIVNQTVPAALRKLGYDENEIKSIVEYIDKNDTIEGAPGLEDQHLSVFDCAFKAMNGVRSIHHMGHVKMMAAAQPFLSGAISKTVNMPQDCTVEDIMDAYIQSWKLGVKAVAIYRDNSKRTQPLSTSSDAQKAEKKETEVRRAMRRKLPDERNSITHKFSIAGQEGYFMVGLYEDGSPGEIFIKMSKEGSTISGLMDSFAVAISMCLQYGVPLRVLVNKFSHTRFEPSGYTTNREIPIAKSLMDYIFRWFDQKFHPNGDNGFVGKPAHAEDGTDSKKADLAPASVASAPASPSLFSASTHEEGARNGNLADAQASLMQSQADSPPCPNCGAITVRSGSCYKCNECGTTTGCG